MMYRVLLIYILLIAPISIALFLYGFFPTSHYGDAIATREDIPRYIENISIQIDVLYKPMVKKLIIMVIDALRWDFVTGSIGKFAMPVMSNLLMNSSACLLKARLQSPTVTMPRIKAMMTGTVPNYVDIVLNFGSKPLSSDNVLLQAKKQGHKLVFYGDDTWLSLFPSIFERYDGVSSFFVTDFTEVDNNVTRHIQDELNRNDWSMMILHYLGLDHIGHIEGPYGISVKPKLQEMDEIISRIARQIQHWNNNSIPALFIICGDHGMKESGGHGGSTLQETTVPFLMIGKTSCSTEKYKSEAIEIEQLDIAVMLSATLGLPIPSTNLGSIFLDSIYDLTDSKRLFLLYYNTKQVYEHFRKLIGHESQNIHKKYLNTVALHIAWLNASEKSSEMIEDIVSSYNAILKEMKNILISNLVKYDICSIIMAMLLLFHILCILLVIQDLAKSTYKRILFFFILNISLYLGINYFVNFENMTLLYPTSTFNLLSMLFIVSILYINCHLLASTKHINLSMIKITKRSKMRVFFICAMLLHIVSLTSSSFIEEEHQTWYFFWTSMIVCLLYHNSGLSIYYQHDSRYSFCVALYNKLLLLLIGHRILRKLNNTGDKYAHLPDWADWLKEDNSKVGITFLLLAALISLIWIIYVHEDKRYKWQSLILNVAIMICIYLRHAANGAVGKLSSYFSSSGIYEVQTFWIITTLFFINCGYRIRLIIKHDKKCFMSTVLFFMINTWVIISAMLHKPYNVILLPTQIIASSMIDTVLKKNNMFDLSIFAHYWLGNVFYFYQGNSNSLSSIDVAAGYVGLRSYLPFITGAYLIINTYSAPVLAYLLFIYYRQSNEIYCNDTIVQTSRTYIAWRLMTMTVYTVIVTIQRHHLFIWSVFSPKLLYEATYSVIMCCSILLVLTVITLQSIVTSNYTMILQS